MAFQIITDTAERDVEVGRVRIEFHVSNLVEGAATERVQTETGSMIVSTPETTALDLVRFPAACGYWNNIATVLAELAEKLDADKLVADATRVARSDAQRLGWLLELVEKNDLADALENALEGQRLLPTPLTSARDCADAPLDPRWRVLVNDEVEPDL
jgi:predicted transcriptional regulator of viral defense system